MFEDFESFSVELVVESPYGIVQALRMTMPAFALKEHFMNAVNNAASRVDPLRITMKRSIPVWCQFEQKAINREAFVRFMNNAYLAWMDEQKGNTNEV